jgi:putative ABC transport system ATP-binding protein
MSTVIALDRIAKVYGHGETAVHALRGVSLAVERGEYVAIMGTSGSGKSTLMHLLGLLDQPSSGSYRLDGVDVAGLDEGAQSLVRSRRIGFVFQAFNLIPRTTAAANVELPLSYAKVSRTERRQRVAAALAQVGLSDRAGHKPNQLSGGQQQRVAVARALVTAPSLLLADEPTGNLDSRSTADILDLFDRLHGSGRTIILITHEDEVAERAGRVIRLRDGDVVSDTARTALGGRR